MRYETVEMLTNGEEHWQNLSMEACTLVRFSELLKLSRRQNTSSINRLLWQHVSGKMSRWFAEDLIRATTFFREDTKAVSSLSPLNDNDPGDWSFTMVGNFIRVFINSNGSEMTLTVHVEQDVSKLGTTHRTSVVNLKDADAARWYGELLSAVAEKPVEVRMGR